MVRQLSAGVGTVVILAGAAPYGGRSAVPMHSTGGDSSLVVPLTDTGGLTLMGVNARAAIYNGRRSVEIRETPTPSQPDSLESMALVNGVHFKNGTINVLVASTLAPGVDTSLRGFIGVVFHTSAGAGHLEAVYLRPTNGRADDQLRRNHVTQYESMPDFPWHRLRKESPGRYESYVDIEPGVWTRIRIVVDGTRARLFVNDAPQPCLVVTDLKLGESTGGVGLWIGYGTIGYFSDMRITR